MLPNWLASKLTSPAHPRLRSHAPRYRPPARRALRRSCARADARRLPLGTAAGTLDVSDVRATLFNTGSLFYSETASAAYVVPQETGISPIFAAGIWVGGLIDGDLRAAGSRYTNFEFWPGPLNKDASLPNPNDCSGFDRIFVVSRADISAYEKTGTATPDLADWPVALGAPVLDGDGVVGNYDLAGGDRPLVYGSQTAFWVMNDVGNEHNESDTAPIGLEVRVTAFSIVARGRGAPQRDVLPLRARQPQQRAVHRRLPRLLHRPRPRRRERRLHRGGHDAEPRLCLQRGD